MDGDEWRWRIKNGGGWSDCGPVDGDGLISIWNCGEFVRLWVRELGAA